MNRRSFFTRLAAFTAALFGARKALQPASGKSVVLEFPIYGAQLEKLVRHPTIASMFAICPPYTSVDGIKFYPAYTTTGMPKASVYAILLDPADHAHETDGSFSRYPLYRVNTDREMSKVTFVRQEWGSAV